MGDAPQGGRRFESTIVLQKHKQQRHVSKIVLHYCKMDGGGEAMPAHWDDLRLFLSVARAASLTAAGKSLRLDPATLGRRMARLETALGAALFVKSPQGYVLTTAGETLRDKAEAAEEAVMAATAALGQAGDPDQLRGQIRIGAPDGCANYVLPQVCAQLAARHPELDIQIVALPRVFNLSRREADIAIGVSAPRTGRVTVQKITDYHLHLAATQRYLDQAPALSQAQDLHQHAIVGYIPDMIFDRELDYLGDLGLPRVALASNSVSVQLNLLRAGAGVGIVHDFALPAAPGVMRVLTDEIRFKRSFYLIRHAGDETHHRASRFATELAAGIRAEVARLEAET